MKRIKLDFASYSDNALLVLVKACLLALTGNIFFPTLTDPSLAEFQTSVNAYDAALAAAADRSKNNVAAKDARKAELVNVLIRMALQLMKEADGNLEALVSTALPLYKTREPRPPIGIPDIHSIENGLNSGELDVKVFSLSGARTFIYQYTEDPLSASSVWTSLNSTRTKQTITGLQVGKRYWIRIIAYGTNNQMTISDPVLSKIVQ
jgi:hypothetical protein